MKVRSWSKPHTFQSAPRMLSVDHLNIDGLLFPVKCVRKLRSALCGEVVHRSVCVCVCVCVCVDRWMGGGGGNPTKSKKEV